MTARERLRAAGRSLAWVLGPALAAAWRRLRGATPSGGAGLDLAAAEPPPVSPYRVAAPPTWLADEPETALPPEPRAPRPDAPYVPLPGPPVSVSK